MELEDLLITQKQMVTVNHRLDTIEKILEMVNEQFKIDTEMHKDLNEIIALISKKMGVEVGK